MLISGINGFGRFGLHLLKYWLVRAGDAGFSIDYINDDIIDIKQAIKIIKNDKYVSFDEYSITIDNGYILINDTSNNFYKIKYTNFPSHQVQWRGDPDLVLECSGRNTCRADAAYFLNNNTKKVIIAATSWDADATLVYGFNHESYSDSHNIISYGSCTVNAYVMFSQYIHNKFDVINSDVNVIHNVPEYKLDLFDTLDRRMCTLEKMGPKLLNFLSNTNFNVNYTLIPYSGISMIDLRFEVKNMLNLDDILTEIENDINGGILDGLYSFIDEDNGGESINGTEYSTVFIKNKIKVLQNNLYFYGYFDNENSVNRYFDLVNYISGEIH
jgi:glyceraldehyde 3-phosphate dehydrogenase